MTTDNSTINRAKPTVQDIYQSGIIFDEIADMAARVQYLAIQIVAADSDSSLGCVSELAATARFLASQIGWAADFGGGKLNGTGHGSIKGGAEQWFMPPTYFFNQGVQK